MSIPQYLYSATIPPEDGPPEDAGAISHTFTACNDDLAREVCEAQGWRFDGRAMEPTAEVTSEDWKKPTPPRRKSAAQPKRANGAESVANPLLTRAQVQALVITARQAYDHLDSFGLIEVEGKTKTARFNAWRAEVCKEITGKDSFRQVKNWDYRPLRAELLKLAGKPYEETKNIFRGKQSRQIKDTAEAREQLIARLNKALFDHASSDHENAGQVGEAYVMTVAKRKNPKVTLSDFASLLTLPARELEHLCHTIINRIASKEGRGESASRNKKQRGEES